MVQRLRKASVCRTARQALHGVSHRKCARSCIPLPPCKHTNAVTWVPSTWLPRILMTFQRCPTPPNTLHTGNSSQLLRTLDSVTTTAARCGFWGSYASHHVSCCLSVPSLSPWHVMAFPESFRKKKKCLWLLNENRVCLPNHKSSVYLQWNSQRAQVSFAVASCHGDYSVHWKTSFT